jgi:hypothetical protein
VPGEPVWEGRRVGAEQPAREMRPDVDPAGGRATDCAGGTERGIDDGMQTICGVRFGGFFGWGGGWNG